MEHEKDMYDLEDENKEEHVKEEMTPTKSKNWWQRKALPDKIWFTILTGTAIIFLFFGFLGQFIFKEGTVFYELSVNTIGKFFNVIAFIGKSYVHILETVVIIVFIWAINKIIYVLMKVITIEGSKAQTMGRLITSILKYTLMIVGIFLILSAWGVQTTALLASAGILGLALSFGAQSLIQDVLAGLFIIFEEQFQVGDVVEVNGFRGKVIDIGIRTTKIESLLGDVKIISNSDIRNTINASNNAIITIIEIPIPYREDLERVEKILEANFEGMAKRNPKIMEGPYYTGVNGFDERGVIIRVNIKTLELDKFEARRAINRELKLLFDKEGIHIPHKQITVVSENLDKGDKQ
ncbi:MAG: mechanosensitive ion channel family protein [Acholeplasmataceae bacterium]|jgi:small-conductance mechanosensitive channel